MKPRPVPYDITKGGTKGLKVEADLDTLVENGVLETV